MEQIRRYVLAMQELSVYAKQDYNLISESCSRAGVQPPEWETFRFAYCLGYVQGAASDERMKHLFDQAEKELANGE